MKMKYFIITLLVILINTQDDESIFEEEQPKIISKEASIVDKTKDKIFYCFEFIEYYIIKSHNYIKQDLSIAYPLDLLCFVFIGIIIYYITSRVNKKVK
jgi:hypothetical protein